MQKSNDGVNPQATQRDIAYLAGIWDGEGHLSIICHHRERNSYQYRIACALANTNDAIIEKVVGILDKLGISATIECKQHPNPNHKDCYYVVVNKMTAAKKLVDIILPDLAGKKAAAGLFLRYVNSRLSREKSNSKVTDEEVSLYEQLKAINQRGAPETTRETPQGEEIVHTS